MVETNSDYLSTSKEEERGRGAAWKVLRSLQNWSYASWPVLEDRPAGAKVSLQQHTAFWWEQCGLVTAGGPAETTTVGSEAATAAVKQPSHPSVSVARAASWVLGAQGQDGKNRFPFVMTHCHLHPCEGLGT